MTEKIRIAWLTTGRGPGSYGALEYTFQAIDDGLPVEIAVVFVNRAPGESEATDRLMDLIRSHGVPLETLSSVAFRKARGGKVTKPGEPLAPWRSEFDTEVAGRLAAYDFTLGVMFGYMLIVTEALYGRFTFMNDHPALPDGPIGTWQEVIAALMRGGKRESGCLMHLVTGNVDRGAPVAFCRYPIFDDRTKPLWLSYMSLYRMTQEPTFEETLLFQEIRRRGVLRERPFLCETLRAIAEERLILPPPAGAADLTKAVEEALTSNGPGLTR